MDVNRIVAELDSEILRLQQIKAALTGLTAPSLALGKKTGRGRPKGSKNTPKTSAPAALKAVTKTTAAKKTKRKLSPEGRKRIADAMKRRWAERRKEAGK
jgi:hypothetical protein